MLVLSIAAVASAHILMDQPTPVTTQLKVGPCGAGPHVRGTAIAVYEPGATITVEWHETIDHPSTYRIAFDDDGDDSFADPATPDDFYADDTVLLDDIPDEADGVFSVEVTLPDVTCETCTLQLLQLMLDKPPYVPGTNDLYYQCSDIALRTGAGTETPPTESDTAAGTPVPEQTEAGGCGCDGSRADAGALAAAVALLLLRRRSGPTGDDPLRVVRATRPHRPVGRD